MRSWIVLDELPFALDLAARPERGVLRLVKAQYSTLTSLGCEQPDWSGEGRDRLRSVYRTSAQNGDKVSELGRKRIAKPAQRTYLDVQR